MPAFYCHSRCFPRPPDKNACIFDKTGVESCSIRGNEMNDHVQENFEVFQAILPTLPADKTGKFALMRDKKIVEFFDSAGDAMKVAQLAFPDTNYSLQQVIHRPIDLGYFSNALHIASF